jgi:ubiquinone/menaquinone biosynthesis C-methylase UbiE
LPPARSKVEIGTWGARYYDLFLNVLSLGQYSYFIRRVIEKMGINSGHSILDLGSGTGKNECFMAEKIGPYGKIVGIDISDEMLSRARKRCRNQPNVIFKKQRVELPLPYKEDFETVFISFVLHGFENTQKLGIIHNAYQALKAGGSLYILDYAEFDLGRMWFPLRWAFTHWECQLAAEFLKLDIKKMLRSQGFGNFEEEFFFKRYLRLLKAAKPSVNTT